MQKFNELEELKKEAIRKSASTSANDGNDERPFEKNAELELDEQDLEELFRRTSKTSLREISNTAKQYHNYFMDVENEPLEQIDDESSEYNSELSDDYDALTTRLDPEKPIHLRPPYPLPRSWGRMILSLDKSSSHLGSETKGVHLHLRILSPESIEFIKVKCNPIVVYMDPPLILATDTNRTDGYITTQEL
ncbi:hypothetical protein HK100_011680, partial [Physocladia obscura]